MKYRGVKKFVWAHTAEKWEGQVSDLDAENLAPAFRFLLPWRTATYITYNRKKKEIDTGGESGTQEK